MTTSELHDVMAAKIARRDERIAELEAEVERLRADGERLDISVSSDELKSRKNLMDRGGWPECCDFLAYVNRHFLDICAAIDAARKGQV